MWEEAGTIRHMYGSVGVNWHHQAQVALWGLDWHYQTLVAPCRAITAQFPAILCLSPEQGWTT